MENRLQPTFIPHKANVPGDPYTRPKGSNFLMTAAVVLLVLVLIAFGGLYMYRGQLVTTNEQKKAQIEEIIRNFEPELTRELSVLKARIDAGVQILDKHTAFSLFLALLEINTAETVRFTDLAYDSSGDKINLRLQGEASTYNAIAFQSDVFSRLEPIKNPIISGLNLNETGRINFNVTAELDPATVSYKKLVEIFVPPVVQESVVETPVEGQVEIEPEPPES